MAKFIFAVPTGGSVEDDSTSVNVYAESKPQKGKNAEVELSRTWEESENDFYTRVGVLSGISPGLADNEPPDFDGIKRASFTFEAGSLYTVLEFDASKKNLDGIRWNVTGGKGVDTLSSSTVSGGVYDGSTGNDTITLNGANQTAKGGAGNDKITVKGKKATVTGDAGDDTIIIGATNATVNGGTGNDKITVNANNATVTGGAGDDTIIISATNATVNGGAGNDKITVNANDVKVTGGAGNDTFTVGKSVKSVTITDLAKGDKIVLNSSVAKLVATKSGKNIVLNAADKTGKVTGKLAITLSGSKEITSAIKNISVTNGKMATTIGKLLYTPVDFAGSATVKLAGDKKGTKGVFAVAKTDDARKKKSASAVYLAKADSSYTTVGTVTSTKTYVAVNGAAGQSITAAAGWKVTGTKNADTITAGAGGATLTGGKGDDILTGGSGKDVFIYAAGDGKDMIRNYTGGKDSIQLAKGTTISNAKAVGNHAVLTIGNGSVTVQNAVKNKTSVDVVSNKKTISYLIGSNSAKNTLKGSSNAGYILGGGKADQLTAGTGGATLVGGKGDDILTGGKGTDIFQYTKGDGKDVIRNYTGKDKIQLIGDSIAKYTVDKKGNTVLNLKGGGQITLNSYTGKLSLLDSKGVTTTTYGLSAKKGTYTFPKKGKKTAALLADTNTLTAETVSTEKLADAAAALALVDNALGTFADTNASILLTESTITPENQSILISEAGN